VAHWNARDVDSVLRHYAEHARFSSPLAVRLTGRGVLASKQEVESYWRRAVDGIKRMRFTLERTSWDADARVLVILYLAELDERRVSGCEVMTFGADGKIVRGDAFYGTERPAGGG
jgi:hypothetical protein